MVGAERRGRRRRRGPRSVASLLNRCHKCVGEKNERPPRDGGLCQSKPEPSLDLEFRILHVNLRGFISHRTELEARLTRLGSTEIVCITETFFFSTQHPEVTESTTLNRPRAKALINKSRAEGCAILASSYERNIAPPSPRALGQRKCLTPFDGGRSRLGD